MTIKINEFAVQTKMTIHKGDDYNGVREWVSMLKESGKNGDIVELANGMCAMNYLGWMYYEKGKGKVEIAENFFKGYRSLQHWAYQEDKNGNKLNISKDEAIALYAALD